MIQQPKRGEVARWMLWVTVLAVVALSGTIAYLDRTHRAEIREKDAQLSACLKEQAELERAFRAEIAQVYDRVGKAIQEVKQVKRGGRK
jgi:tellurite resistance protein